MLKERQQHKETIMIRRKNITEFAILNNDTGKWQNTMLKSLLASYHEEGDKLIILGQQFVSNAMAVIEGDETIILQSTTTDFETGARVYLRIPIDDWLELQGVESESDVTAKM
jgi:hypothetical protein